MHADTVEVLLKEKDLTLATTIMHCRSREEAKKHCSDITEVEPGTIAAARVPYQARSKTCTGCGGPWHKAGLQPIATMYTLPQSRAFCHGVSQ